MTRLLAWFYETRHNMCATPDTIWVRVADQFIVECRCCTFWRGMLLGGMIGALVGVLAGALAG